MWGKHLIIDMSAGDRERVQSAQHISRFVETSKQTLRIKRKNISATLESIN